MMFYENAVCDGCGQPLSEKDDVVVCPDCGTPQHRKCYELNNKCVNEHLHESGFEWKNPEPPVEAPSEASPAPEPERENNGEPIPVGMPMPALDVNPSFFVSAGVDPESEFDGVKAKDVVSYTQVGAKRYLKKFLRTDGKKFFLSWNWGAFVFAPAWFFYRKLYKVGFIFISVVIALDLFFFPQMEKIAQFSDSSQAAYSELVEAGKAYRADGSDESKAVLDQKTAAAQEILRQLAPMELKVLLGTFLIPNTVAALLANWLYKRKTLADIKTAHKFSSDQKVVKYSLLRRGGVAIIPAMAAFMLEYYFPNLIVQIVQSIFLK